MFSFLFHITIIWLEWTNNHQCTSSRCGRSSRFGDEPETHPLPMPKDFSTPFSASKLSPPTYLPHLISCSLHLKNSKKFSSLNSIELQRDVRHKAWGRWKGQCWKNVERSALKECGKEKVRGALHPKCKSKRRQVTSLLFLHFFSVLSFLFFCLRKDAIIFFFHVFVSYLPPPHVFFCVIVATKKATTTCCHHLLLW